jgi:hypothetical protein
MILSLLSMFGGGLMRLLPELLTFLNKKTDNEHELLMLDKQFQLESTREASKRETVALQGSLDNALAVLEAQKIALQSQMQKTGISVVDALNFLVRPLTTYYVLLMYGIAKIAMFAVAINQTGNVWAAVLQVYDAEDRAILSGILAFWFVGRTIEKK